MCSVAVFAVWFCAVKSLVGAFGIDAHMMDGVGLRTGYLGVAGIRGGVELLLCFGGNVRNAVALGEFLCVANAHLI